MIYWICEKQFDKLEFDGVICMIKEYLATGFRYFVYIFGCLWLTLLVSLITTLAARFVVVKDSMEETVVQMIVMIITMNISLFICSYRKGYTDRNFNLKMVFIPIVIALILQLLYAKIFSFSLYTSGPAFYAGKIYQLLQGGTELGVYDGFIFPFMLLFDILYIVIAIAGEYIGVKKRSLESKKLTSK